MTKLEERLRSGLRRAGDLIPATVDDKAPRGAGLDRRGVRAGLIALIVVFAIFTPLLLVMTSDRAGSPATDTSSPDAAILFPVELGVDQLWPATPSNLEPTALAFQFLNEAIGWTLTYQGEVRVAENLHSAGKTWLRLNQEGIHEPADILLTPVGDGELVITQVGIPWAVGVDASALDTGGTRVGLLRIVNAVADEVTMRLSDGRQIVASTHPVLSSSRPLGIDFPDIDPALVRSILIRYVDEEGEVVAQNGASGLDLISGPSMVEY